MSAAPTSRVAAAAALLVATGATGATGAAARADEGVRHVPSSLEPAGELLDAELVDLEGDGRLEACLAVRTPDGRRELRFHRVGATRVEPEPFRSVPVLDETLAWGVADVRAEAGRELLFLTATGCWSYSLAHEGYRGNARLLAQEELLYDVPAPRALPYWAYVFPRAGGDWVLLPASDGYAVWGPDAQEGGEAYRTLARFAPHDLARLGRRRGRDSDSDSGGGTELRVGSGGARIESTRARSSFLDPGLDLDEDARDRSFLTSQRGYRAPALVDVDGDGLLDLLELTGDELTLRLGGGSGLASAPERVERVPDYLDRDDVRLELADLDADGDVDLLAQCSDEVDGMESVEFSLLVLLNDGERLLPERPSQVLRFETSLLVAQVADVDGDGRADLTVREFDLPSLTGVVTGLEFRLTQLVFLGRAGSPPFERKPALKTSQTFDENNALEAVANRELELDFDGDGIGDMVEIDVGGRVSIRRLQRERSFFGGESWSLETTPWRRFEAFGEIDSLEVRDLNDDGLGDVVSRGPRTLSFLVSSRPGGGSR